MRSGLWRQFSFIRNLHMYRTGHLLAPVANLVGGRFVMMSSELLEQDFLVKWAAKTCSLVPCLKANFNCFLEHSNLIRRPFQLRIC